MDTAMTRGDEAGDGVVPVECDADVNDAALFPDTEPSLILTSFDELSKTTTPEELAEAARKGIGQLQLKKTGSTSPDTKHKSLRERWFGPAPEPERKEPSQEEVSIKRNVHVKLEISEGRGKAKKVAMEDYRVLAIYTKTYNKWYLCQHQKQN